MNANHVQLSISFVKYANVNLNVVSSCAACFVSDAISMHVPKRWT